MTPQETDPTSSVSARLAAYPLLDALRGRRSRRFGKGMNLPAGPLAHQSRFEPVPLTEEETAALAFAACGITGHALADLCYAPGQGGNIMAGLVARTIASGDGIQTVALVVTDHRGTWLVKRPRDFAPAEIRQLIELGRTGALTEVYRRSRVKIKEGRAAPPADPLFNINANRWSAHAPGTTCFLPVNDLTLMYINGLLEIFNETTGAFVLDERAGYRPAGLEKFARRRGGHLEDDPARGRVATVRHVETLVTEFVAIEQGMMLQNLGLMTQALGLGGWPSFANHEFGWFEALGFRMGGMPASRYLGANRLVTLGMNLLHRNPQVPYPIGLEINGQVLLKPFCPPWYPSMTAAVRAVVDLKFGRSGIFRSPDCDAAWADTPGTVRQIDGLSDAAVAATAAYCEYIWSRYGRFPAYFAPYKTILCHHANHLDPEFYRKFYRPEALSETQRMDFERTATTNR